MNTFFSNRCVAQSCIKIEQTKRTGKGFQLVFRKPGSTRFG